MSLAPLLPHPDAPPAALASLVCAVKRDGPGSWCFDYIVSGPPEALRLPPAAPPMRADGLWQRTCFELFLRRPGDVEYYEFNFSPSGEWAAYRFERYRAGMTALPIRAPRITSSNPAQLASGMRARLSALGIDVETAKTGAVGFGSGVVANYALSVRLDDPAFDLRGTWLAAITAVIEEADGTKSYWALTHAGEKPDFHHPAGFVLDLPGEL